MSSVPLLYRAAVRVMRASSPLLAHGDSKLARGIRGRRHALDTLEGWGRTQRDPSRPAAWFHAPSVGEGLQAGAVVHALFARRPDLQVAFTYFSPSAEGLGDRLGVDVATYLPWDVAEPSERALDALKPSLLAFTKTEVWPVLAEVSTRRGTPVAMIAARVREGAGRLRWPARRALRATWASLDLACAISAEDGERLVALGVRPTAVRITGDPGVDAAARRLEEAEPDEACLGAFRAAGRPTLVAGSTWPEDEAVLAAAWPAVRKRDANALLVVAPHEPTPERVSALIGRFRAMRLVCATLEDVARATSVDGVDIVIVDSVGILAHLYKVATVAFVGGGFGRNGLHSVLEPAAAGAPTLFGPRYEDSRAARELAELGAARPIADGAALEAAVQEWLSDPGKKNRAAARALDYIGAHRGAAERTAELLEPFIEEKKWNE